MRLRHPNSRRRKLAPKDPRKRRAPRRRKRGPADDVLPLVGTAVIGGLTVGAMQRL